MAIKAGKFSNPFGSGSIYISQTYHSGSNNKYAVDFGSKPAGSPVYAVANGVISNATYSGGSYCTLNIDDSSINLFYVHTYKWLKPGTKVKKGQKICEIAPSSVNGGFADHLHLGIEGVAKLMDYFDRSLNFKTIYSDIRKDWFIGDKLNWSLFKDLSYLNSNMKVGNKVEITADTNMRFAPGTDSKIAYTVKKGSVGTLIDGPRTADGYEWWDIEFIDCPKVSKYHSGWMANVGGNRFKVTSKAVTCMDVSTPTTPPEAPDCSEYLKQIDALVSTIEALETRIRQLETQQKALQVENERLQVIEQNVKEFNMAHKKLIS